MGIGDGTSSSPPWHGYPLWGAKIREKSDGWWKELGHEIAPYRKNKRASAGAIKEEDHDWYDPPVKDGVSMAGMFGVDTKTSPNLAKKYYQPGNFYDFQKKIMKESRQYKQIAEKFEISDEHPGIDVSPELKSLNHLRPHEIGKGGPFNNSFYHFGPRFWDKPINEGCFEKGLCLMKYAALLNITFTGMQLKAFPKFPFRENWNMRFMFNTYLRNLPLPCAVSFAYGVGLCSSAAIRNQDDLWNYVAASVVSSTILSTAKGSFSLGVTTAIGTSILAFFYQLCRTSVEGFGRSVTHDPGGFPLANGPFAWKYYEGTDAKIPERTHW